MLLVQGIVGEDTSKHACAVADMATAMNAAAGLVVAPNTRQPVLDEAAPCALRALRFWPHTASPNAAPNHRSRFESACTQGRPCLAWWAPRCRATPSSAIPVPLPPPSMFLRHAARALPFVEHRACAVAWHAGTLVSSYDDSYACE